MKGRVAVHVLEIRVHLQRGPLKGRLKKYSHMLQRIAEMLRGPLKGAHAMPLGIAEILSNPPIRPSRPGPSLAPGFVGESAHLAFVEEPGEDVHVVPEGTLVEGRPPRAVLHLDRAPGPRLRLGRGLKLGLRL